MGTPARALGANARVISLVGMAHFMSHVYQFSLPPLMPLLTVEMGVSYTALALPLTLFSLATALGQMPMGFLVDRIGGRVILIIGLAVQAVAIGVIGFAGSYWALLVLYNVAGVAHTVYHPADYAILSHTIDKARLGKAFSLHTITGNMGTTVTPAVMAGVAALWDWRAAFVAIAIVGIGVAMFLWSQGGVLDGDLAAQAARRRRASRPGEFGAGLRLLFSAPMMMFFLFYFLLTVGFSGVRSFTPSALVEMYGFPIEVANGALTGYMVGILLGVLVGGVIADRIGPRNITAVIGLVSASALMIVIASVSLPVVLIFAALTAAGMLRGSIQATRDLLTHSVTPDGSHGKVFAFVSSGSHIGQALMPLGFGWILDNASPGWVFMTAGIMALVALITFVGIKWKSRRKSARHT